MRTRTLKALCNRLLALALLLLLGAGCASPPPAAPTPTPAATPAPTPRLDVTLETRPPPTAAVLRITPTPTLTPSPTPTVTPEVYLIQPGDTLLAIAIDRGTSVEAIQALNPAVDPRLLQIDQPLLLPPPATPVFAGGGPTRVPLLIDVASAAVYRSPTGDLWLLGEIVNQSSAAADNVQLAITLLDENGTALATAAAWVAPPLLAPGAWGVFGVQVPAPAAETLLPSVSVAAGETVVDAGNRATDLSVEVALEAGNGPQAAVSGVVGNPGDRPVEEVVIVVALFDAEGLLSGYVLVPLADPLPAGGTAPFAARLVPPGAAPLSVRAAAFGLRVGEAE